MANVKRYDPEARYVGAGEYLGNMAEEENGDYVTHDSYVAREAELLGRIKALREGVCACVSGRVALETVLANDDAAAVGGVVSDG